jgi:hypothetical protein
MLLASGADRALQLGCGSWPRADAGPELAGQIKPLKVPVATECIENCSVSNQTYEDSYLCNATPSGVLVKLSQDA